MAQVFPFNYVSTMFSTIRSFTNRDYLKIWQMILLILLLNSLMLFPLSLQVGRTTGANLFDYVPEAMSSIDDAVVERLKRVPADGERLIIEEEEVLKAEDSSFVALATSPDQAIAMLEDRIGVVFTPHAFLVSEEGSVAIQQHYTGQASLSQVSSVDELTTLMSQQWFGSNRTAIVLTNFIYTWLLVFTSLIILIFGASFFLSFMRKNRAYHITSFREAFTIILNCIGLPTLLAMVIGLITGNAIHMLSAQGLLLVIMLITVYWRTHFNDDYVREILAKRNTDN